MRRRGSLVAALIAAVAVIALLPASASAYRLDFTKYFGLKDASGQAHSLEAKKCHRGLRGSWTLTAPLS